MHGILDFRLAGFARVHGLALLDEGLHPSEHRRPAAAVVLTGFRLGSKSAVAQLDQRAISAR